MFDFFCFKWKMSLAGPNKCTWVYSVIDALPSIDTFTAGENEASLSFGRTVPTVACLEDMWRAVSKPISSSGLKTLHNSCRLSWERRLDLNIITGSQRRNPRLRSSLHSDLDGFLQNNPSKLLKLCQRISYLTRQTCHRCCLGKQTLLYCWIHTH